MRISLTPTDAERPEFEQNRGQALWYAWGREDGGEALTGTAGAPNTPPKDPGRGDAWDFAENYASRYLAYRRQLIFFGPAMRDAFSRWQAGEDLCEDVRVRLAARAAERRDAAGWRTPAERALDAHRQG